MASRTGIEVSEMVLEPALTNDLIELLAANFKTDEVSELGGLILGDFDSNLATATTNHVSISSRKSAKALVDHCADCSKLAELLKLVVEVDEGVVHGRPVRVQGLEAFLSKLLRSGIHYDFKTRRIVTACKEPDELPNWGCLKEGREYDMTVLSLDITNNSDLVRTHGLKRMEKLYYGLWSFLKEKLAAADGRIWSWAGDGGIIAFALEDHTRRAVRFAVEVQTSMPIFNLTDESDAQVDISLRVGIDSGKVKFNLDTGKIVSDVINYAAHLEKKATRPGCVSFSRVVYEALSPRLGGLFHTGGLFEDKEYYTTQRRLDGLLLERSSEEESLTDAEKSRPARRGKKRTPQV
jgi:class 3 adenylate cyclase